VYYGTGVDATVGTSGTLGLNINVGFGASQATLTSQGYNQTSVSSLGGDIYAIAVTTQQLAQQFTDTGPAAMLTVGGNFALSASASG